MFGWMKRKAEHSKIEAARADMSLYLDSLRGMTSSEMATGKVLAAVVLLKLGEDATVLRGILDGDIQDPRTVETVMASLERTLRSAQKDKNLLVASGLILWIHSVRAVSLPPLRAMGRDVWREILRGEPNFNDAVFSLITSGLNPPPGLGAEARYVPAMLDPSVS